MRKLALVLCSISFLTLISCKKDNSSVMEEPEYSIMISSLKKSKLTYTVSVQKLVH